MREALLEFCKALLQLPIDVDDFGCIDHPFFFSLIMPDENGKYFDILESEENEDKAREIMNGILDDCKTIYDLTNVLNVKHYLIFYDYGQIYMSPQERGEFIQNTYSKIESLGEMDSRFKNRFLGYLREIDKEYLMNEEDKAFYDSLPANINIYRGVNGNNTKSGKVTKDLWKSIYWTTDLDKAIWFANRFVNEKSSIEKAVYSVTIPKEYVIFACEYENQICLDYKKIHDKDVKKTIL